MIFFGIVSIAIFYIRVIKDMHFHCLLFDLARQFWLYFQKVHLILLVTFVLNRLFHFKAWLKRRATGPVKKLKCYNSFRICPAGFLVSTRRLPGKKKKKKKSRFLLFFQTFWLCSFWHLICFIIVLLIDITNNDQCDIFMQITPTFCITDIFHSHQKLQMQLIFFL